MGQGQGVAGLRLCVACAICFAVLAIVPAAQAQFQITNWNAQVYKSAVEADANVFDEAGGHPFIGVTDFTLAGGNARNVRVDVPPGLVPNPDLAPRCSMTQLATGLCPTSSQIGTEELTIALGAIEASVRVPLYNLEIEDDQVSRFGFNPADAAVVPGLGVLLGALGLHPVEIIGGVRDSAAVANPTGTGVHQFPADLGLFFTISDAPATPTISRSKLTFWGVPGAHAGELGQACINGLCIPRPPVGGPPDPDLPFLTNPTECAGVPTRTRLIVESHGGAFASALELTPTIDGKDGPQHCENVPFAPRLEVVPGVTVPDSPAGPELTLGVPQNGLEDKDVLTTAHVKGVSVTLPPGMTINPSAANGLEACTDAQFEAGPGVPGGDECPEASRIGSVEVSTPLLPPLPGQADPGVDMAGAAFVGQPLPGDMYRLFLTAEGRGVSVRLKGSVRPDSATGQLTAVFDHGNPQLPFDRLAVDLRDGPRAPLATPLECGPVTASGTFTPFSGTPPVSSPAGFEIGGAGCPAAFQPAFGASSASHAAGAFSPLFVSIGREDRNEFLGRVTVALPPGLGARIRGVTQCPDALAASGACPPSSRIGTATTTAGAGPEPYRLSGPVYFTGPYRGAPFGMAVVIRAIAGPFDLGTVVVRQAIHVDPEDAHLTVVSDPLPQILAGVPIRLRTIDLAIDRPEFVYNPTSCGDKQAGGTLQSTRGTAIDRAAALRYDGCERLAFAPKTSLRLTGPRQMAPGRHPGLVARVTQADGQANVGGARVRLPLSLALDPFNTRNVCGYEAGLRADCPAATRIGSATAVSPALNRPLRGPVYLVQGIRIHPQTGARIRTLPSLLAKLDGEVRINLRGTTDVERLRLVSTFERVPDGPISRFELKIAGGRRGILAVTGRRGICQRRRVSDFQLTGQNGKQAVSRVRMAAPCRSPALRIRRARASGARLVVRGTVARRAGRKVRVVLRCGGTRVTTAAKRPRPGRWTATLRRRGACAGAGRARLRVAYPGGGDFRPAVRRRGVKLPS
jgi:hypothetical protein